MQYSDCEFCYRNSIFLQRPWVITDVALQFQKGQANQIHSDMLQILRERRRKFPRRLPSCGSVFKSNLILYEKYGPSSKVIGGLGFKGASLGDAQVSNQHANFIINKGNATAADMLKLIHIIRNKVHEKTNIWLECEVRYVSPNGKIVPAHDVL